MAATPAPDPWHWPPTPQLQQVPVALLRLEGPDTLRVLHGQTSQAIEAAQPGARLATCCISPTARLRALAEVLVDADGAWLVISAGDGAAVRAALDRVLFPADRVVLGTLEPALMAEAVESNAPTDAAMAGTWQSLDDDAGWWLGEQRAVLRQGADLPAALASLPVLDARGQERWRLQQGLPAVPGEINDDTNPFELGLADRVSLSKGCYVGQETLAKLATYDGVKQQLRRWIALPRTEDAATPGQGPDALKTGMPLRTQSGERAGRISSVLALPEGGVIGLALVRRCGLEEPVLLAGEAGIPILPSVPAGFMPPPTGSVR